MGKLPLPVSLLSYWDGGSLGPPFVSTIHPTHQVLRSPGEPPLSPARLGTGPWVRPRVQEQAVFGGGRLLEHRALAGK